MQVGTSDNKPKFVYVGKAVEIGYELGKKKYMPNDKNDLLIMKEKSEVLFEELFQTVNGGECGWISSNMIEYKRIDAPYLLNIIARDKLKEEHSQTVSLGELYSISEQYVAVSAEKEYRYLEIPDLSDNTAMISNIRTLKGSEILSSRMQSVRGGDILFSRINPRKSRVTLVPNEMGLVLTSGEIYVLQYKENNYISYDNRYCVIPLLQSKMVKDQLVRLSTGSSSSRARIPQDELLTDVYVQIPSREVQCKLSNNVVNMTEKYWLQAQDVLSKYIENQILLGGEEETKHIRSI